MSFIIVLSSDGSSVYLAAPTSETDCKTTSSKQEAAIFNFEQLLDEIFNLHEYHNLWGEPLEV